MNMKMLHCYAVTLFDLSMKSAVNQPFRCENTEVSLPYVTPAVINVVILCERLNDVETQEGTYFGRYGRKITPGEESVAELTR